MMYFINYFLFCSIVLLIILLNIDNMYELWCTKNKDDKDYIAKKTNLNNIIAELKEDYFYIVIMICLFGWVLLPIILLLMLNTFFKTLTIRKNDK